MSAAIKSMPTALMDRVFPHPSDNPEALAIRNENTPANRAARRRMAERNAMEDRIRRLLAQEFAALKPTERGYLAAYWTDCWGYSQDQVAEQLRLKDITVRVAKWRALGKHPCDAPSGCQGIRDCAHRRGQDLWNAIVRRVTSKLGFEEDEDE